MFQRFSNQDFYTIAQAAQSRKEPIVMRRRVRIRDLEPTGSYRVTRSVCVMEPTGKFYRSTSVFTTAHRREPEDYRVDPSSFPQLVMPRGYRPVSSAQLAAAQTSGSSKRPSRKGTRVATAGPVSEGVSDG